MRRGLKTMTENTLTEKLERVFEFNGNYLRESYIKDDLQKLIDRYKNVFAPTIEEKKIEELIKLILIKVLQEWTE